MDAPLYSVIVPVYNVEKFLPECVDSILNQTLTDFELILVDDGSPDNCPAICDAYAAKDSRVKVIHKPNGGVSSARNAGLDAAKGKYIGFVDSDDFIENNMFERLMETALREGSDLTICSAFVVDEAGNMLHELATNETELRGALSGEEMLELLVKSPNTKYVVLWNKLYTRNLISSCRFPKGKINEDSYVIHHLYDRSQKTVFIPDALYHYRTREGSIMHSKKTVRYFDIVEVLLDRTQLLLRRGRSDLAEPILIQAVSMLASLYLEVNTKDAEFRQRIRQLRKELLRNAKSISKYTSNRNRMKMLLLRVFPAYVCLKKMRLLVHGSQNHEQ